MTPDMHVPDWSEQKYLVNKIQLIWKDVNTPSIKTWMWKFRRIKSPGQEKQDLNKFFHHDLFYAAIYWWTQVMLLHFSTDNIMKHNAGQPDIQGRRACTNTRSLVPFETGITGAPFLLLNGFCLSLAEIKLFLSSGHYLIWRLSSCTLVGYIL